MIAYIKKLLDGQPVEWKKLGEVGVFVRGSGLQKKDLKDSGVPAIHYGQIYTYYGRSTDETKSFVTEDLAEKSRLASPGDLIIATTSENDEDVCKAVAWLGEGALVVSSDACFYSHSLDPKYITYIFESHIFQDQKRKFITGTKVRRVNVRDLAQISIPVPPLSVQVEIVRILDKFTELEAGLEAELEARKQQYEYYRNSLLSFANDLEGGGKIVFKTLGEVFFMRNGYTPSKAKKEFWEGGTIPWYRMEDLRAGTRVLSDAIQHVTPEAIKGKGLFKANSIIMATTATIGEHALLAVEALANQQFTNFEIKPEYQAILLPKFAYYYFFVIDAWCKQNTNVSSFPSVAISNLKTQEIPIPPLTEQARIVNILDKFDALTNSLTEGLPQEIELRRKQYEYYREQLLIF